MILFDRHRRTRNKLSAYIDGQLSNDEVRSLDGHLESCDSCRLELDQMRATVNAMRSLPEVETPRSFRLTPAMVAERRPVDAWSPAPPLMNGMRMAAAGLTVALAVVLVVDLGGSSRSVNDEADTIGMFSPPGIEAGADTTDRSTAADDLEDPAPDVAAGANDDGGFRELDGVAQSAGATAPDATPAPEAADEVTASNLTLSGGEVQEPAAESGSDVDEVLAPVAESGGDFDELLAAEIGLGIALGIVVVAGAGMTLASRSRGRRV